MLPLLHPKIHKARPPACRSAERSPVKIIKNCETRGRVRASLTRVFGADLPPTVIELAAHPTAGLRVIA